MGTCCLPLKYKYEDYFKENLNKMTISKITYEELHTLIYSFNNDKIQTSLDNISRANNTRKSGAMPNMGNTSVMDLEKFNNIISKDDYKIICNKLLTATKSDINDTDTDNKDKDKDNTNDVMKNPLNNDKKGQEFQLALLDKLYDPQKSKLFLNLFSLINTKHIDTHYNSPITDVKSNEKLINLFYFELNKYFNNQLCYGDIKHFLDEYLLRNLSTPFEEYKNSTEDNGVKLDLEEIIEYEISHNKRKEIVNKITLDFEHSVLTNIEDEFERNSHLLTQNDFKIIVNSEYFFFYIIDIRNSFLSISIDG